MLDARRSQAEGTNDDHERSDGLKYPFTLHRLSIRVSGLSVLDNISQDRSHIKTVRVYLLPVLNLIYFTDLV